MGSGTHCSKIDGFPGTHGTHANRATAVQYSIKRKKEQRLLQQKQQNWQLPAAFERPCFALLANYYYKVWRSSIPVVFRGRPAVL